MKIKKRVGGALIGLPLLLGSASSLSAINVNYSGGNVYKDSCENLTWSLEANFYDYTESDYNAIIANGGIWHGSYSVDGDDGLNQYSGGHQTFLYSFDTPSGEYMSWGVYCVGPWEGETQFAGDLDGASGYCGPISTGSWCS